jgi:NADPH:quinone reductase-like Zn-dependent oxidoreductase
MESFKEFTSMLEESKIRPVIDSTFMIEQIKEAYEHLESGQHFGKIVVKV